MNTAEYEANYKAYIDACEQINPETGCHMTSPVCPTITVGGKPYCLLPSKICRVRALADCNNRYPYMSFEEAKNRADFWVDIKDSFTVTIGSNKVGAV